MDEYLRRQQEKREEARIDEIRVRDYDLLQADKQALLGWVEDWYYNYEPDHPRPKLYRCQQVFDRIQEDIETLMEKLRQTIEGL